MEGKGPLSCRRQGFGAGARSLPLLSASVGLTDWLASRNESANRYVLVIPL